MPARTEEERGLACFVAYVRGDDEVPQTVSCVRDLSPETLRAVLRRHRAELESIDPAREVILESMYGGL